MAYSACEWPTVACEWPTEPVSRVASLACGCEWPVQTSCLDRALGSFLSGQAFIVCTLYSVHSVQCAVCTARLTTLYLSALFYSPCTVPHFFLLFTLLFSLCTLLSMNPKILAGCL